MESAQSLPTMKGLPVLGNLLDFRRDRIAFLMRAYREHGELVRAPVLGRNIWVATSPEIARAVLVTHNDAFQKFEALARFSRPLLGDGLITSEGEKHRRRRRLIQPGFKVGRLRKYVDAMARRADDTVKRWSGDRVDDLLLEMTRLTLAIASETMFNTATEKYTTAVGNAVREGMDYIATELARPIHVPLSWPTPRHRRLHEAIATLDRIVYGIIRERRQSGVAVEDTLSMLLAARDEDDGSSMSDEDVRDEAMTLLLAGHETTASALTWSLYLLGRHRDVADRLAEEARTVLGGRPPTFEDLEKLPVALRVFKESMRLCPPVYMVGREAKATATVGKWEVPAGTTFLVSIYGIHHRPDLYPDPDRFDPDRFLPEREKDLPRGAYLPFADGPRVCIGNHFALMEGQIVLAHLGQHFAFGADGPLVPHLARVTLRPRDRIALSLRRRDAA
jgi:cytochrome P450